MTSAIRVKKTQLEELKKIHRLSDTQLAKQIGVSKQTLWRAMEGENVSAGFVAGTCLYFRTPFEALFEFVSQTQDVAA
ncbi:MAG: hypothetical protein Q3976_05770 [Corynebacterium sp.]|nr:hypothetical protein [Corynebacterium sp.]